MFGKVSVFQTKDDVGSDRRAEKSRSCCCAVANWLKSIAATGAEGNHSGREHRQQRSVRQEHSVNQW